MQFLAGSHPQDTPSNIDFFLAGPPCQPFSLQGSQQGLADPRAALLLLVVLWVCRKTPHTFIIEQVRGLLTVAPDLLVYILKTLQGMKTPQGQPMYTVQFRVLDASKHGGLPQHRERMFIVGVKNSKLKHPLVWPTEAGALSQNPNVC